MLKFDEKTNRLFAYKHEFAIPPKPVRDISWERKSVDKYIAERLREDVENEFIPRLRETLKCDEYDLPLADVQVQLQESTYFGSKEWKVKVGFPAFTANGREIKYLTIMGLPYIEEDGRIYHERKYYSYIKLLEQEPTVSYEDTSPIDKALKIRLPKGFVKILYGAKGPMISTSDIKSKSSNIKFDLLTTIFAMARDEGYSPEEIWDEFRNLVIRNIPKSEEYLENIFMGLQASVGSVNSIDYINKVVPRLTGKPIKDYSRLSEDNAREVLIENFETSSVRDCLNSVLSLDRAIGQTLGEDIYSVTNPGTLLYNAGITITSDVIKTCNRNGVYKVYIDKRANVEGLFLAETVILEHIPRGTKMIPELEYYLPEETGMYVSKDYDLKGTNPIMLTDNMQLSKDMVDVLYTCGYRSIRLSEKAGKAFSGKPDDTFVLYFSEEVLSNRMFLATDVGRTDLGTKWVYLNANNEFEACPRFWTTYDLAALLSLVAKLFAGECLQTVTNADSGFRKKIVTVEELYSRAFRSACIRGLQKVGNSLRGIWQNGVKRAEFLEESTNNKFYALDKSFWDYLTQDADCLELLSGDSITNPMSYISALTKLKVQVPSKHAVSDSQRRIAIGSYGRVDAFEIPQSHKLGVVLNLCIDCKVDLDGNMMVGYRRLIHNGRQTTLSREIEYLTVAQEEAERIADIGSIDWNEQGVCLDNTQMCLCRCPSVSSLDKQSFSYVRVNKCTYVNAHANQPLSWASATICHLDSNDGNRATFGIAQAKQGKGLEKSEAPRVGTSANIYIPMLNNYFGVIAKKSGTVDYIAYHYHKDKSVDEKTNTLVEEPTYSIGLIYDDGETETIEFDEISSSGYSVCLRQVIVEKGYHFQEGEVLVTSNFMDGNSMAIGRNLLVGYIPTGKNYEDGTNATVSACHKLSSYKLYEVGSTNRFNKKADLRIVEARYGKYINPSVDGFAKASVSRKEGSPKVPIRVDKGHGFLEHCDVKIRVNSHGGREYDGVAVKFVSVDIFSNGDKGSNRHGNKGVMPSPEKNSTMMRLPNGVILDIAYNPHGVTSRMNVGQTRESNLGLSCHVLDVYCISDPYNGISAEEISMLMKYVYELANSTGDPKSICAKYPLIPAGLHARACARIGKIRAWADTFDEKGECYLYDPKTGKMTETKALIGINHVFKLIQESDSKVHARAGAMANEPYARISGAATKGSSHHGGQRFGTMEMDGLCGYGAAHLIHELTNERGDNNVARSNMNARLFLPDSVAEQYIIDSPGQRRATTELLYTLLALGVKAECDNGEFIPLSRNNSDELGYYKIETLKKVKSAYELSEDGSTEEEEVVETPTPVKNSSAAVQEAGLTLRGIRN